MYSSGGVAHHGGGDIAIALRSVTVGGAGDAATTTEGPRTHSCSSVPEGASALPLGFACGVGYRLRRDAAAWDVCEGVKGKGQDRNRRLVRLRVCLRSPKEGHRPSGRDSRLSIFDSWSVSGKPR